MNLSYEKQAFWGKETDAIQSNMLKRKVALSLINDFVEDFKANAPIWKYDLKNAQRIYAKDRSQAINGAGILS